MFAARAALQPGPLQQLLSSVLLMLGVICATVCLLLLAA
jgi:hypothetical protein